MNRLPIINQFIHFYYVRIIHSCIGLSSQHFAAEIIISFVHFFRTKNDWKIRLCNVDDPTTTSQYVDDDERKKSRKKKYERRRRRRRKQGRCRKRTKHNYILSSYRLFSHMLQKYFEVLHTRSNAGRKKMYKKTRIEKKKTETKRMGLTPLLLPLSLCLSERAAAVTVVVAHCQRFRYRTFHLYSNLWKCPWHSISGGYSEHTYRDTLTYFRFVVVIVIVSVVVARAYWELRSSRAERRWGWRRKKISRKLSFEVHKKKRMKKKAKNNMYSPCLHAWMYTENPISSTLHYGYALMLYACSWIYFCGPIFVSFSLLTEVVRFLFLFERDFEQQQQRKKRREYNRNEQEPKCSWENM